MASNPSLNGTLNLLSLASPHSINNIDIYEP